MRFTGEVVQKMDGKGRVSIPASMRAVLEAHDPKFIAGAAPRMYLQWAAHLEGHLRAYTVEALEKLQDEIEEMDYGDEQDLLRQLYMTEVTELSLDKDGRIVLPQAQREQLGLPEGQLAFLGAGTYFEIWPGESYQATKKAKTAEMLERLGKGGNPLALLRRSKSG